MNPQELQELADQGNPIALEMLASLHETGMFPGGADPKEAVKLYEKLASNHNSARAMLKLGMLYCAGKCDSGLIDQDFKKGRSWIDKGYELVDPNDPIDQMFCKELGFFVGQGENRENRRSNSKDIYQSIGFLKKALKNEEQLKKLAQPGQENEYIKQVKEYLKNREELLESEEGLEQRVDNLKDILK